MDMSNPVFAYPKPQPRVVDRIQQKRQRRPVVACPVCGKPSRSGQKTCSAACGYRMRKERTRKPKACPVCSKEFYPIRHGSKWSQHCSLACARVKWAERLAMIPVTCAECFRVFRRTKGAVKRVQRSFCNKVCARKFYSGENAPGWRGGHDPNRGPKWLALAARIRERDGHVCQRCGRTEAENGQKLDVDHIQPWRSLILFGIEVANDPENLTSLCRKCHRWKTGTVERRWLESGDCVSMSEYQRQVKLPPLFARI